MLTALITFAILAVTPTDVAVETLDGQQIVGKLTDLDSQSLTVETSKGRRELSVKMVARILQEKASAAKLARPTVWLALVDDTQLTATKFLIDGDRADLRLTTGQSLRIPRREIRHLRLKTQSEALARQWQKILRTETDADLLVIRKQGKIDFLEGIVGDVDGTHVKFTFDGDVIPVKLDKVEGIVYHRRASDDRPEAKVIFHAADGMLLPAVNWRLNEKAVLFVKTPLGLEITHPFAAIRRVDLTAGKLAYLSDLEPVATKWTPYIGGGDELPLLEVMFRPRRDRAMDGGPLRLGGREHSKGLAIHSRTLLTYDMRGKYRRFKALAGIDDRMRDRGHVELVIKGDGRQIYKGIIQGKDDPLALDLDVSKVRRLEILVDYGEDLDIADHLNLIEARVIK